MFKDPSSNIAMISLTEKLNKKKLDYKYHIVAKNLHPKHKRDIHKVDIKKISVAKEHLS
jgi:hypothetical protein